MKKIKTREELTESFYFSKTEIKRLLDIPQAKANQIYEIADAWDTEHLKYRVFDTSVSRKGLCEATEIPWYQIKQIARKRKENEQ